MNSHKSTTEMKSAARELLLGKYGSYIGAYITAELLLTLISVIASSVLPADSTWGMVFNLAISFVIELIAAVFLLGMIHFTMNICTGRPYQLSDVFYGFRSHPDKAIICKFLFLAAELVCMLPAILFAVLYSITENGLLLVVASLFLVIGMVIAVIIHLSLYFVYYLILDYPDATIKELIQYCADMMNGHRIKLFYLYASFLPMYALGILSFGIGLLFVEPYVNVTVAQFYLDVFFIEASADEVQIEDNVVRENIEG